MRKIEQDILDYITANPNSGRSAIRKNVAPKRDDSTISRILANLVSMDAIESSGQGPATVYCLAGAAAVRAHLEIPFNQRPDVHYNQDFLDAYIPRKTYYLPAEDRAALAEAGRPEEKIPAGTYAGRILKRLMVDLSWASSRMEGNTYDLIQTEKLIEIGMEAEGKDRKEAQMILNHKAAIEYVVKNIATIDLSRRTFFDIHALLADGLLDDPATIGCLRQGSVTIGHSSYTPLDIPSVIEEEFNIILKKASAITDPFEQSFFLMVHIPYLQGFRDVNKRVSRLTANIPLLKADLAPMSFMRMNDEKYTSGILGIYEINNVALLREAYIESYLASARKYRVLSAEVDVPDKAASVYRESVKKAIRHCVLEAGAFRRKEVLALVAKDGVPEEDRSDVADYVHKQFRGLHEGNLIRYDLQPDDLKAVVIE